MGIGHWLFALSSSSPSSSPAPPASPASPAPPAPPTTSSPTPYSPLPTPSFIQFSLIVAIAPFLSLGSVSFRVWA
ncbi:hypothetical protein [Nostoc sp. CHAB 5715]|uniref:hypothetical protein n=1 Tax=Nostoc sp. CHAB 5715 TaxID=2780400 RepID=UPI001E537427|nr:hypothetical protein [Nostoc sp. CHAB 5715]MCC5625724.1 hypothetical protein [Nostoc sp. CHAB 5715]